jgi:hypothetical protein
MDITREEYIKWLESKGFRYSYRSNLAGDIYELCGHLVRVPYVTYSYYVDDNGFHRPEQKEFSSLSASKAFIEQILQNKATEINIPNKNLGEQ